MHCSRPQQRRIADILVDELGDLLLTAEEAEDLAREPAGGVGTLSPQALRNKIIVKGKVKVGKPSAKRSGSNDGEGFIDLESSHVGSRMGGRGGRTMARGGRATRFATGTHFASHRRTGGGGALARTSRLLTFVRRRRASSEAEEQQMRQEKQKAVDDLRARLATEAEADNEQFDLEVGTAVGPVDEGDEEGDEASDGTNRKPRARRSCLDSFGVAVGKVVWVLRR